MLYYLYSYSLQNPDYSFLRIFQYVTFRAAGAAVFAFLLALLFGKLTVRVLKHWQAVAPSRHEGLLPPEELDKKKNATPSMGGLLILCRSS